MLIGIYSTVEPVYGGHCVMQPPVYTSHKLLSESVITYSILPH